MRKVTKPKWLSVRKAENAYLVVAFVGAGFGVSKLATLPKVHSNLGLLPVWQLDAGIIGGVLFWVLFHLIDGEDK